MKLVINKCYGGFSLSNRAIKAVCDRKGIPCHFFARGRLGGPHERITDEEAFQSPELFGVSAYRCERPEEIPMKENWHEMTQEQLKASNEAHAAVLVPDCLDIDRNDPDLLAVVEELGEAANGLYAELSVVEIPDDVDWRVEEYDGNEWVAEKHRTWA